MGVLTKLSLKKINSLAKNYNMEFSSIEPTSYGITDTTYICRLNDSNKFVFKIFEESTACSVKQELKTLNSLDKLCVPRVISEDIFFYEKRPICLYSFIEGEILKDIKEVHLLQIVDFLVKLHKIKSIKPKSKNIYTKYYLKQMLCSIEDVKLKDEFIKRYKLIKAIKLKENGIIHGDLFPDNAKFVGSRLSGVYDFAQSCYSDIRFDFAVVIISWCFKDYSFKIELFKKALQSYKRVYSFNKKQIKEYLLFACLYYSLQRLTKRKQKRDYREFIKKFDILEEIL